jgi:hypothetical protein
LPRLGAYSLLLPIYTLSSMTMIGVMMPVRNLFRVYFIILTARVV